MSRSQSAVFFSITFRSSLIICSRSSSLPGTLNSTFALSVGVAVNSHTSDGLHSALEAKENLKIQGETQTYATITLQNFFRMYDRLAGMTGTASVSGWEFAAVYDLQVVPMEQRDREDVVGRRAVGIRRQP